MPSLLADLPDPAALRSWFAEHVSLSGEPYYLDLDQATAVFDQHHNTLVTARAGSGKTRVIVAKIAYLVASNQAKLSEIAAFMFNRTAAAEVNQRISEVRIDGRPLTEISENSFVPAISVASTFHKFALDITKIAGEQPKIISELDNHRLIKQALDAAILESRQKVPRAEYMDLLKLTASFIARAGQQFAGEASLSELCSAVENFLLDHPGPDHAESNRIHQFALAAYLKYLAALRSPQTNFNALMTRATSLLRHAAGMRHDPIYQKFHPLKFLLVDEYQDFSYLFFALIQAVREVAPSAHLFAVGDDWQAINRFAGSDVNYFIKFSHYFPEDCINIPLLTNYRSDRRIVENANDYMLKHYDPAAARAKAFSKSRGAIHRQNYAKTRFNARDFEEDALGDGRFLKLLIAGMERTGANFNPEKDLKSLIPVAKLLKTSAKIVAKHPREPIMFLHRHNFTSFAPVTLDVFCAALRAFVVHEAILTAAQFSRQVRFLTMHRSKGLESDVVILLEVNRELVLSSHPHATIFQIFGDTAAAEQSDQHRLLYVALTRAKHHLYILTADDDPAV